MLSMKRNSGGLQQMPGAVNMGCVAYGLQGL